jgi:hypothetical protein
VSEGHLSVVASVLELLESEGPCINVNLLILGW